MTDREFWLVLAIHIEEAHALPSDPEGSPHTGLCFVLDTARELGLVNLRQFIRLRLQLWRARPARVYAPWAFYWPMRDWRARARCCRRIAETLAEEGKT